MNPVEKFLRERIEKDALFSESARAELYKNLDASIRQRASSQNLEADVGLLDFLAEARRNIEADFFLSSTATQYEPTWRKTLNILEKHWKKITAVGAVVTFFSEFVKPLGDYTLLLLVLGIVGLLGAGIVRWRSKSHRISQSCEMIFVVCGFLAVSSLTMLAARPFIPEAQARGVIGATIPGLSAIQDQLFQIAKRTDDIARNTDATAKNTESIVKKLDSLSRDTSDDPLKELANLGFAGDTDRAFSAALRTGNVRLLELVGAAGHRLTPWDKSILSVHWAQPAMSRPDFRSALFRIYPETMSVLCDTDPGNDTDSFASNVEALGRIEYERMCGPNSISLALSKALEANKRLWESACVLEFQTNDMAQQMIDQSTAGPSIAAQRARHRRIEREIACEYARLEEFVAKQGGWANIQFVNAISFFKSEEAIKRLRVVLR